MTVIHHERDYKVRKHEVWSADVPPEMLTDPKYFDKYGWPTADFDEWMCQNGVIGYERNELLDDDELGFDSESPEYNRHFTQAVKADREPYEWAEYFEMGAAHTDQTTMED